MKYIIMCGGQYNQFKLPKQLLKVNGEILVERTIRLLKENGINDIAISTNNPAFDYLEVEKLRHKNDYTIDNNQNNKKSAYTWLNAYYPIEEPCCYLHGDVYFSEEAIKSIVNTPVKETMFFCVRDLSDGRPTGINAKGREPLAYKVANQEVFRKAINEILQMIDDGNFKEGVEPISWHLYRQINGLELGFNAKDNGYANNIFKTKGDYIVIDDYTTDIDSITDIPKVEKTIKIMKGEFKMIRVEVIEEFTLEKFNELRNLVRSNPNKKEIGRLYIKDTFECDEEMADYLGGNNAIHRAVIKVIEVIPDEVNEEIVQAVANAIAEEADEQGKEIHEVVEEIIEEATEPKKKPAKRKTTTKKK